ncbi:MAG: hypothetical protein IKC14_05735, partial [Kiritimatiellae bacterium]|nr:hypothetical protein [Kiritimatiellia bacterium]
EYKTMMPDAVTMTAEENDTADLPVPEALAITPAGENAVKVAAGLKAGSATRVTVKLSDGREAVLTETAVGAGWRGEHTFTGLTPETIFLVSVRYENAAGDDITLAVDDAWYNGPIAITAQSDALEETLEPGRFVFMRATGEASVRYPLTIAYTVGGSATPDADYTALSGTVTIPAGEASATVEVQPLKNPLVDSRINVTVTVADGFYPPSAASATLAIRNFRSPSIVKFTKRMEIAVAADKYTGSALKDFPVPVRLREGENGFSYSDFRLEGGADMAFFDADGNVYPHEIDTWNPQGESLVWVKVPSFSASTRFFIGYSAAVANESKAREVWSAYTGVWHMGEAAAAATTLYDATAHQLNGTYGALSSTMEGKLGNGRMMTTTSAKPSSAGRTLVPHQASMDVDAQYLYASMWVKYTGGSWGYLITRKNDDKTQTWGFQMNTSSKAMRFYGDRGTYQELSWGGSDFPTEWTMLDLVMSGGTYGLYVNGEKRAGMPGQNWPNNNGSTAGIAIGAPVGDTWSAFYGAMDEVRLTSTFTPSDDWIRAQYLLESDATALTYGTVGTVSTGDMTIVDSARVVLKDEVPTVTARLLSGTATVSLVLRDEAGVETRLPLGTGPVTAPHEFELPLTALPGSGWYDLATIAEDASGDCDEKTWAVRVKKDAIAVGKAFDADATALRTGAFVISRPADDARLDEALEVPYVLAGSLVNGSDYTKLSGKVTIPAGKTSVQVPVEPLIEGKTGDVTLTLAAANMTAVPGGNRATVKVRADGKAESRVVLKVKGYSGAAVENVPVLVRLTEGFAGFSYGRLRNPSTGSDLHFQDERGNELPFEIDEWHPDGESVIWVRMSRLARGARLAVCYGGDAIASEAIPENRSETWAEQTAVYHMIMNAGSNNRYGNSAGTNIDASRGWNNNSVVQGSGVSGFGQLISSGVYNEKDNHGVLFNNESEAFKSTDGTFTASCWIKYTQGQVPAYDRILCHKKKYSDTTGWEFMLYDKEPTKLRFRASGEAAADM